MARPKLSESVKPEREWLFEKRINENLTLKQIGELLGITRKSVEYWVRKYEIPNPEQIPRTRKKVMLKLKCDWCGIEYEKEKYYIDGKKERNKLFFCSKACKYKYDSERQKGEMNPYVISGVLFGENSPHWQGGKKKIPCVVCGKVKIEYNIYQQKEFDEGVKQPCCSAECGAILSHRVTPFFETSIERIMKEELINNGLKFESQYIYKDRYSIDFYLPDFDIGVECDGDYWHGNPAKYPSPSEFQVKTIKKDKRKNKYFLTHGSLLLRFWETDINNDIETCLNTILKSVEYRKNCLTI